MPRNADQDSGRQPSPQQVPRNFNAALVGQLLPGASGSAWYLFANPNVLPAFEIVFLNGRRTPVIERVEMPANTLGMGFRSYIDFGVNSQDPRAAVKVTGE